MNSSESPIFSIIVPVYNVADYLEKCLGSIASQELKNIEVIVVDDGSSDSSLEICNQFAANNTNFQVFTKKNEGQGLARNYGLDQAKGKYICFVDSDDWIEPNLCSDAYKIMEESSADFLNYGLEFFSHSGKSMKRLDRFAVKELKGGEIFCRALLDDQILSTPWNKIYRRKILDDHAIRFPPLRANEDIYFSRAVSRVASKTVFVSNIYYHALVRPDSTTRMMSISNFNITENLINLERKKFFNKDKDQSLEYLFCAHVVKLFSYLLIQAAFRIKNYSEYIACFDVAKRSDFFEYSSNPHVLVLLKEKNKWMVKICSFPRILRFIAIILRSIGVQPY